MEFPHRGTSKANLADDRTENAKREEYAIERATEKLTQKIFELELLEVMARETGIRIRTKEKEIVEHKRKLEELQYEKWSRMNDFCDRVWKFSSMNNLTDLLNKYLDRPKRNRSKTAIDNEQHPEVVKLRSDLDKLKEQLAEKKAHTVTLEKKALQAKVQLNIAETYYREKDPTIIRLTKEIDEYEAEVSALEIKIQAMKKKKSKDWSRLFLTPLSETDNDNFVTAAELIAREEKSSTKKTKFTVKKESAISRKLADIGWTGRRD